MLPRVVGGSILCVVGARPNFMKIAPVIRAMNAATPPLPVRLLHTGQHYDPEMNSQYFQGLGIPDTNTVVGSSPEHILAAVDDILRTGGKAGRVPELWDGRASQRIAAVLREWLDRTTERRVA